MIESVTDTQTHTGKLIFCPCINALHSIGQTARSSKDLTLLENKRVHFVSLKWDILNVTGTSGHDHTPMHTVTAELSNSLA